MIKKVNLMFIFLASILLLACGSESLEGTYSDENDFVKYTFNSNGKVIIATFMGSEIEVDYERDGDEVRLFSGEETQIMRLQSDGSLSSAAGNLSKGNEGGNADSSGLDNNQMEGAAIIGQWEIDEVFINGDKDEISECYRSDVVEYKIDGTYGFLESFSSGMDELGNECDNPPRVGSWKLVGDVIVIDSEDFVIDISKNMFSETLTISGEDMDFEGTYQFKEVFTKIN